MTPQRFVALTDAYGAAIEHWPQAERAAALALIEQREPLALAALAEARQLDRLLAAHVVAAPAPALVSRIVAEARPVAPWQRWRRWFIGSTQRDLRHDRRSPAGNGASLRGVALLGVGVGVAGIAAGILMVSLLTQTVAAPGLTELTYSSTAFGSLTQDWSNE